MDRIGPGRRVRLVRALGMARLVDPAFPKNLAAAHDALIAAYERRLLASATGGPIGNALLLALLTSGPELAP